MFGLLSKKATSEAEAQTYPALIEVWSWHTSLTHIVETGGVEPKDARVSPALCGHDSWVLPTATFAVTAEKVKNRRPRQHSKSRWCLGCAERVASKP